MSNLQRFTELTFCQCNTCKKDKVRNKTYERDKFHLGYICKEYSYRDEKGKRWNGLKCPDCFSRRAKRVSKNKRVMLKGELNEYR
jgi:hypothetical protein